MLNTLTLKQTLDKLEKKEISLAEVYADVRKSLSQNEKINAYLTLNEQMEQDGKSSENLPLKGIPLAIKDNFCTKGLRTTASSTLLDNFIPQFESTVTKRLKEAGASFIGKTNLDAWAHGSSTETSQYGRTLNPRNTEYLPGGSSGGSAAAVAADMCIAAMGTETAGSIRQPSAWCGTVGLKPTYGRTSRYGVVSMASSTDSPGPITKTVEDAAILLNHFAGHDSHDSTTSTQAVPDYTKALNKSVKNMKIGVLYMDQPGLQEIKASFEQQLKVFEELGANVENAQAMDPNHAIGVYTVVQRAEVSSNLARYTGVRYGNDRSYFGDEAKRRIMLGTFTLSKGYSDQYYLSAQKVRTLFIQDYSKLFAKYDVLIAPTSPGYAKKVGASESSTMFGELEDLLVEPSSIAGLPGINVPCFHDPITNLYLGMDIIAPMWQEEKIISVADAFEKNTSWNSWRSTQK
jgi:aspartyl-tRNA(Asn)/glutamyl-tRNA(Gln) amidotransferase subunit A